MIPDNYREFATKRQYEMMEAVEKHGTVAKAARELGVKRQSIQTALKQVKAKAALQGYAPEYDMTKMAPDPFVLKGVSTYYDADGNPRGQWVKTKLDPERRAAMITAAIDAACQALPRVAPVKPPEMVAAEFCNVITMTDCHIGMKAWGEETGGESWDLAIAERVLTQSFEYMLNNSPMADTCVVAQLGDFLHYDSLQAVTPTSGHNLDADSRFSKMVKVAIRVLRRIIDMALARHKKVVVVIAEGNHDMASSAWLRHMFAALYENEPRVELVNSEAPYYAFRFGKVMLGWHHSHLSPMEKLPMVFAARYPELWGKTTYRVAHTGDKHHAKELDYGGMKVIQHSTLASADAYAARYGYHSIRDAKVITYHAERGEVTRVTVDPTMFKH